jgi:transcriptional regulator with XRE-family HTH domain
VSFGAHIKRLREARGLSIRELSRRVDVESSYVSKVERDEVKPPGEETIVKLAHELGENPHVLLGLAGKVSSEIQRIILKRPLLFAALIESFKEAPDEALEKAARPVRDGDW